MTALVPVVCIVSLGMYTKDTYRDAVGASFAVVGACTRCSGTSGGATVSARSRIDAEFGPLAYSARRLAEVVVSPARDAAEHLCIAFAVERSALIR